MYTHIYIYIQNMYIFTMLPGPGGDPHTPPGPVQAALRAPTSPTAAAAVAPGGGWGRPPSPC